MWRQREKKSRRDAEKERGVETGREKKRERGVETERKNRERGVETERKNRERGVETERKNRERGVETERKKEKKMTRERGRERERDWDTERSHVNATDLTKHVLKLKIFKRFLLHFFLQIAKNRFTPAKIRFYWEEMLEALKAVHDAGIVHADIKPSNFLLVT